jgi:hypothetical protein
MERMDKEGAVLKELDKWMKDNKEVEVKAIKVKEEDNNEEFKKVDELSKKELKNNNREIEEEKRCKNRGIVWRDGGCNWGWKKINKIVNRAKQLKKWTDLNRNEFLKKETMENKVAWKETWERIKKWKNGTTVEQEVWSLKLRIRELPTLEKLKKRQPENYKESLRCISCGKEEETQEHVWQCETVKIIREATIGEMQEIIDKELKEKYKKDKDRSERIKRFKEILEKSAREVGWEQIMRGIVPIEWINWLKEEKIRDKGIILEKLYETLEKGMKEIWNKRSRILRKWKKENKIKDRIIKRKNIRKTRQEGKKKEKRKKKRSKGNIVKEIGIMGKVSEWLKDKNMGIQMNLEDSILLG